MKKADNFFSLKDKVIIITGAAGLLGQKHAEAIAIYGGNPILLDLSLDKVNKLSEDLNYKYSIKSKGFQVDITIESEIEANVSAVINEYGRIDGLINNAAVNPKVESKEDSNFSRLETFSLGQWNDDISVGLTGAFLCAKHYGFAISENSYGGSIINISSDLGKVAPDQRLYRIEGLPDEKQPVKPVSYSVVKTGLIGLTRYLSTYWPQKNVRCNTICLGGVENNQDESFIRSINDRIPLGRMAKSDEYMGSIVWLLSDSSSYMNGSTVTIDGGRTSI